MKTTILRLLILKLVILLNLSCEKQTIEDKSLPIVDKLLISNPYNGSGYINLHYKTDGKIDALVLRNINNHHTLPRWTLPRWRLPGQGSVLIDSIVFDYADSTIYSAVKYRICRYYDEIILPRVGPYTDSLKIYSINLERNYDGLVKKIIDSSQVPVQSELIYDSQNRLVGTKSSETIIKEYKEYNVISYSINDTTLISFTDYDNSYNPFYLINKVLGFPYFNSGYELSKNNPGVIKNMNDTIANERPYYREYNSKGWITKISLALNTIEIRYKN